MKNLNINQSEITEYWEQEVCGTRGILNKQLTLDSHKKITAHRYKVEPHLREFVKFQNISSDSKILEVGVGAGTDFIELCKQGGQVYGIDATQSSIDIVNQRLKFENIKNYNLKKCDAIKLNYSENFFDYIYSYGVIHHAEKTLKILSEFKRVIKPGGKIKLMVYSDFSLVGLMLYIYKGIFKFNFFTSQKELIAKYLESPGTKAYSKREIFKILESFGFTNIKIKKQIGNGDMLLFPPSHKFNNNQFFKFISKIYPRFLVKKLNFLGLFYLIEFDNPLVNKINKKTITIFSNYFKPGIFGGGPIRSLEGIINKLQSKYNFKVICSSHDAFRNNDYTNVLINLWNKFDEYDCYYCQDKNYNFQFIKKIIKSSDNKIFYFNSLFNFKFTLLPIIIIKLFAKESKIIISPSGELNENAIKIKKLKKIIYLFFFKLIFRNINWHITNHYEVSNFRKYFKSKNLFIAPKLNKLIPIKDKKVKKNADELNVVFISRITEIKNIEYAIDIISKMDKKITFKIYGPIETKQYFKKVMDKINKIKTQNVSYEGEVSNEKANKIFQENHLFLFPTKNENYGHVIFESIYNLCPVLISKNTPWSALEHNYFGYDLDLDNKTLFIEKINYFFKMNQESYDDYISKMSKSLNNFHNNNKISVLDKYIDMFG